MRHLKGLAQRLARAPRWLWSRFVTGYLRVRGVDVGRHCSFYGIPRVRRVRGAHINIGDHCVIRSASRSNQFSRGLPTVFSSVLPGAAITLGDYVGASDVVIVAAEKVHIGSRTLLGAESLITDTDGHPACPECRAAKESAGTSEVHIGDECFIGARSIILKGVRLSDGTCVGAGSIVTCGVGELGGVLAGAPAKTIRASSRCDRHEPDGSIPSAEDPS